VTGREPRDLDTFLPPGGALRGRLWQELQSDLAGRQALEAGVRVGPYRVVRELGRGGMGTVYLAERADGQFQQRVALKVLRPEMETEEVLRRFEQERQILASLHHAGIARLFDGGRTDDGRPYFVMEYADGVPIDGHCDANGLPVEERLRLFMKVGEAVQHAHRKLVVHRDLKPSNILVTADGEVKLLDFGIAKVLEAGAGSQAAPVAATTVQVMTPEYASPEQVRGDPVTTASDIYQLGLLLYELLTGRRPHRPHEGTMAELCRAICETSPLAPSAMFSAKTGAAAVPGTDWAPETASRLRSTTPERLRRRLAGDLDTIALMALRKEPERRYTTANEMVEDVQRHLAGWPVRARPATFRYQAGRFLRRHRLAAAAIGLLVLSLAVGVSATAWQAVRARRAAARAQAVTEFLISLFELSSTRRPQSQEVTARELLDRGVQRLDADLADQPDLRASLLGVMGGVYASLGHYDPAAALLERTVALHRQQRPGDRPELARLLSDLASVRGSQGEYGQAAALARESLAMQRRIGGPDHPDIAIALDRLAAALSNQGQQAEVEPLLQEALAMRRRLYGNAHHDVARGINRLGILRFERGDYVGAATHGREALRIARSLPGDGYPSVPESMANLATALSRGGQTAEAVTLQREAVRRFRQHLGDQHPELAPFLRSLATDLKADRQPQEATEVYGQVLAIERATYGPEHHEVAKTTHDLANLLQEQGRLDEAEAHHRQCITILRKLLPPTHPHMGRALSGLASALNEQGKYVEAESSFRQAVTILERGLPPGHDLTAKAQVGLGRALVGQGRRLAEAQGLLERAAAAYRVTFGAADPRTAEVVLHLGACLLARGERQEGRALVKGSLPVLLQAYGEADPRARRARLILASR
jgi:eukaryotic-like serine/threonine-protein kinase